MNTIIRILIITALYWSCGSNYDLLDHHAGHYTVQTIKQKKDVYIIYVKNNGSLFMILSKKQKIVSSDYVKIHCNRRYDFDTQSLLSEPVLSIMKAGVLSSPNIESVNPLLINYNGVEIKIPTNKGIRNVFEASNLKGLYIKKVQ